MVLDNSSYYEELSHTMKLSEQTTPGMRENSAYFERATDCYPLHWCGILIIKF